MPHLQARHRDLFALAHAWAERHDAILAATPPHLRAAAEQRLQRIGIRWGVVDGVRLTREFRALDDI
jgi:DNA-binding NtrC family response regulator